MNISVVIVNYNAGDELDRCVQSLLQSTVVPKIIIVDNASSDRSVSILQENSGKSPCVHLKQNEKNRGFAVACNQGAALTSDETVLFLNPDCVVLPDTLEILSDALHANEHAGMAGGLILNHDGTEQRGCRRRIPNMKTSLMQTLGLARLRRFSKRLFSDFRMDREPLPDCEIAVEAVSGACMMVKRTAMKDVGPLDEGYFLHCEDLDWCLQFAKHGWEILFVPQAILYHSKGTCSARRPYWVEWMKHRGMIRFYKKNYRDSVSCPWYCFVVCGIGLRYLLTVSRVLFRRLLHRGEL